MTQNTYIVDLLTMAIDRYESSKKLKDDVIFGNMSVKLMDKKSYMSNLDFHYRLNINEGAATLEKQGLIRIKWYDKNNIIDRFYFNIETIDQFYKITKVVKKLDNLQEIINNLELYASKVTVSWITEFFKETVVNISLSKKLPAFMQNAQKRVLVLESLLGIDELITINGLMLERAFSKKYLKNSKFFEKEVRVVILGILKKYNSNLNSELSKDEMLLEIGIEKTSNELFIKAPIRLTFDGKILDLKDFPYGTALNTQTFRIAKVYDVNVKRFISIENKANFLNACEKSREGDLIAFSSGYYNPTQRAFLAELRKNILDKQHDCKFYHSGDMDLGGFNIFYHIKKYVIPELIPLNMNCQVFMENIDYAEDFKSEEYKIKLEKLLNEENGVFNELIKLMLKKDKMLEQECLLF